MGYRVYKTGTIVLNFITQRLNSFNFDAGLRNGKVIHHKMIHFSFSAKDSISSIIAEADTRSLGFFLMQRAISFLLQKLRNAFIFCVVNATPRHARTHTHTHTHTRRRERGEGRIRVELSIFCGLSEKRFQKQNYLRTSCDLIDFL